MSDDHSKAAQKQVLLEAANDFIDHRYVDSKDAHHALAYLRVHPEFQPFVLIPPTEEMQTRIDLINSIWAQLHSRAIHPFQNPYPSRSNSHFILGLFCEVPLFVLRELDKNPQRVDGLFTKVFSLTRFGI